MKDEKNKKNKKSGIFIWVISIALGAMAGYLATNNVISGNGGDLSVVGILVDFALFLFMIYLQIIIHEGGHLVFGLISGYRFLSFRIGSLMLVKYQDGMKLKRMNLPGTAGQCLLSPPDPDMENPPVFLYNIGGVVFNLIFSGICGICYVFLPAGYMKRAALYGMLIGIFLALTNGIPIKNSILTNDGYNAWNLRKDFKVRRSFLLQLKINEGQTLGIRLKDMPQEWFELKEEDAPYDSALSTIGVFLENRLLDAGMFEEAQKQIRELETEKYNVIGLYQAFLYLDDVYMDLLKDPELVDAKALQKKEYKSIIRQLKNMPSVLRVMIAFAALKEKDSVKTEKLLKRFEKLKRSYPALSDLESETEMINLALGKREKI